VVFLHAKGLEHLPELDSDIREGSPATIQGSQRPQIPRTRPLWTSGSGTGIAITMFAARRLRRFRTALVLR